MILPFLALLGSVATTAGTVLVTRRNRKRAKPAPARPAQQQQPIHRAGPAQQGFAAGEPSPSTREAKPDARVPANPLTGLVLVQGEAGRKVIDRDIPLHPLAESM